MLVRVHVVTTASDETALQKTDKRIGLLLLFSRDLAVSVSTSEDSYFTQNDKESPDTNTVLPQDYRG